MISIKSTLLKTSAVILLFASLSGCAGILTQSTDWGALGGSRADGTIQLAYNRGAYADEKPIDDRVKQMVIARCNVWGYQDAEPFDYIGSTCVMPGDKFISCYQYRHTAQFQCTKPTGIPSSSGTIITPVSN